MTPDDIADLKVDMKDMNKALSALNLALMALQTNAAHSESSCPYQVQIARNVDGIQIARSDAQQALTLAQNNRVKIAQLVASGAAGGSLVAIVQILLQLVR